MAATTCTPLKTLLLAVAMTTKTASSFTATAPSHKCRTSRKTCTVLHATANNSTAIKKAYNDNALFNFHMMTQAQKISGYSAMDTYVNTQSLWNLAWHDSFVRNGLSDFVPPMCEELNVLVVGERHWRKSAGGDIDVFVNDEDKLAVATRDVALISEADKENQVVSIDALNSLQKSEHADSSSVLATIFGKDTSHKKFNNNEANSKDDALDLTSYDCIMDKGLVADLVSSTIIDDKQTKIDIARLLFEASKRIREMGIYVANTPPMSCESKEYLQYLGELCGMQWEFDLDGISDENTSVNVARKFGTCPEIGWQTLARMIEESKPK